MQRLSRTAVEESLEEDYGNEGDVGAMLDRAFAQRKLRDVTKRRQPPDTD